MSLSTEIQRLHDAKDAIRSAINRKGVQVSSLAKLDDYAEYAAQIQAVEGLAKPVSVDTIVYDSDGHITSVTYNECKTVVAENEFRYNTTLVSISIPYVTTIKTDGFYDSRSMSSISMPSVEVIESVAFYRTLLSSVELPASLISISDRAFYYNTNLSAVTCRAVTPPSAGSNVFSGTASGFVIYVPAESVDAYKTATGWSQYESKIQAIQE